MYCYIKNFPKPVKLFICNKVCHCVMTETLAVVA